ncbi:MBL fold metallo-hydrolase [Paenibacillus lutrae]|uniref:MBL fold metallo-hydrolase n=1 Tax=Paenibacillus lutrae TaxID=2078573 RepID=A0A7X3JY90_9BACL|nr:MBL fold metallo-hydrolase [Paenibacillus lutrae]MVO98670.1 MBL fold metallo-hydrolase [Paenibacillus lutrae]
MIIYENGAVTVFQSSLYQTTSTVIVTDDLVLLADPCLLPGEVEEIRRCINAVRGKKPLYLLFTHGDYDHIIGWGAFPDSLTIGSRDLVRRKDRHEQVKQAREFDRMYYIERDYPVEYPVINMPVEKDGQALRVGDTTVTFYLARGHTPDGVFAVVEEEGVLIAGDYLSGFELPFIEDSYGAYRNTIRLAQRLADSGRIRLLIPGHGTPAGNPAEINRRIQMADTYLNELEAAVRAGDQQMLQELEGRFAFASDFTADCHASNIDRVREELAAAGMDGRKESGPGTE